MASETCWTCGERNRTKAHPAFNCQPDSEAMLEHKREVERAWREQRIAARWPEWVNR